VFTHSGLVIVKKMLGTFKKKGKENFLYVVWMWGGKKKVSKGRKKKFI
jgi:hypothetical protein